MIDILIAIALTRCNINILLAGRARLCPWLAPWRSVVPGVLNCLLPKGRGALAGAKAGWWELERQGGVVEPGQDCQGATFGGPYPM